MKDDNQTNLSRSDVFNEEGFEYLMSQLTETYYFGSNDLGDERELINVWIKVGQLLNIYHFLPHHKLIVNNEGDDNKTKILSYILCSSGKVLDQITDHDIFDQDMVDESVKAIEDKKKGYN